MTALLDVNVLIALFDTKHNFHDIATRWFMDEGRFAWATCPIVENGLIRIVTQPAYHTIDKHTPAQVCEHLQALKQVGSHHFWPDDISFNDLALFDMRDIHKPRQLTDAYLLGLAYRHHGWLVTFDRGITPVYLRDKNAKVVEYL